MTTVTKPVSWLYHKTHWFTDAEAWGVYRFAAYVEAGIWLYFILSILYGALGLPLAEEVVKYGRSLFGTAYGVYVIFVLIAARSMGWGVRCVAAAVLAGIPPFGSIVYERTVARRRRKYPAHIEPPRSAYDD